MKPTRHINRWTARLLMVLVLFAQGVLSNSVYAAPAIKTTAHEQHAMACHEQQAPATSACLTHCSQADQISIDHAVSLAAPVSVATWQVTLPSVQRVAPGMPRQRVVLDTGPPIPIRFCSFLI